VAPTPHRLTSVSALALAIAGALLTPATQARGNAATGSAPAVVQATHDHFIGHVEPDVAINPRNPQDLLGVCQFVVAQRQRLPGSFASFDGGRSWHDNGLLPLPGGFEQGADTTVAFDSRGNGFVAALLAHGGGGYPSRVTRGGIFLWRTSNGGRSFSKPAAVYVGRGFQDHPWLAIRRIARHSTLFITWTNPGGLEFARSLNDGVSFAPPRTLITGSGPANPVLVVGAHREIRIFFEQFAGQRIRLDVVSSSNDGATFGPSHLIAEVTAPPQVGGGPKGGGAPPPLLAAAADSRSTTAAVAIAARDPAAGRPVIELWQRNSQNAPWKGPFRPATGPTAPMTQQQPRLVLAGGTLYVSYFSTSRQGQTSEHLARADITNDRFTINPLDEHPFHAAGFLGDYQALAISKPSGYALWNDAGTGRLEIVSERFNASR
jgi:hypothetical protein